MAWHNEMRPMLRILINDYGDEATDQVYSDTRLEEVLLVAAKYVQQEIGFDTTYTITLQPASLSPDPVGNGDTAFVNLVVLKAACISDFSTFRSKALSAGIEAKCGPIVLKTLKQIDGFKQLIEGGLCQAYENIKQDLQFGNGNVCRAILSPFSSNDFNPNTLAGYGSYYGSERDPYFIR